MYITKEQYQELYGDRETEIGLTFVETINSFKHYYMQRENDVLHVNDEGCINILPVGHLNLTNPSLEPCDEEEFELY